MTPRPSQGLSHYSTGPQRGWATHPGHRAATALHPSSSVTWRRHRVDSAKSRVRPGRNRKSRSLVPRGTWASAGQTPSGLRGWERPLGTREEAVPPSLRTPPLPHLLSPQKPPLPAWVSVPTPSSGQGSTSLAEGRSQAPLVPGPGLGLPAGQVSVIPPRGGVPRPVVVAFFHLHPTLPPLPTRNGQKVFYERHRLLGPGKAEETTQGEGLPRSEGCGSAQA